MIFGQTRIGRGIILCEDGLKTYQNCHIWGYNHPLISYFIGYRLGTRVLTHNHVISVWVSRSGCAFLSDPFGSFRPEERDEKHHAMELHRDGGPSLDLLGKEDGIDM
jgi:hypothetical protein